MEIGFVNELFDSKLVLEALRIRFYVQRGGNKGGDEELSKFYATINLYSCRNPLSNLSVSPSATNTPIQK